MLNVLSLFSGIGAFEKALENLGVPYNLVGYCEIDPYASKAYSLLHHVPMSMNFGDITKIDETRLPSDIDLITYGFPCQDISVAGRKQGFFKDDGTKTRSGLFFDALRIIEATRPKVAIAENVKNLTSEKMKSIFDLVLNSLDEAGYNNYWHVMNAADYDMPQKRERVLIVSIRKDADDGTFTFPATVPLTKCMDNFLDDEVPESFYLSAEKIAKIQHSNFNQEKYRVQNRGGICATLLARDYKDPKVVKCPMEIKQIADLHHYGNDQMNRVYSPKGLCPTLKTVSGGDVK